jgi:protoporphyrinogen oxidase
MMWERCEELLESKGTSTQRGMRVTKIRHRRGRVESVLAQTSSGEVHEYPAGQVISTMCLRELAEVLDPKPPEDVLRAARALRYRDFLTVVLVVKRDAVFPDNWIYIHSPDVKVGRIQNYKNWSPEMVPDPSRTALGLEYFLWNEDPQWNWSDERLLELGIRECVRIGLIKPREVEDGTVTRMKKAYPVYDRDYQQNVAIIAQYLKSFANLQTIGRNGLHRYNNQDHSMLTGVYAARNIAGGKYDVWSINTDSSYHEAGEMGEFDPGDRLVPRTVTV